MTQSPTDPQAKIEIGAVRADELESLLALICEVFQLPYEPARELFYKDPYLTLENKRVLRVNGRIVSCLSIADREVWLGGGTVRVGGIAGVATHPNERNKGYAGLLLENTLAYLKAQGYALSALIPYSAHFYRRFGYEICGHACRFVTAPSYLPKSSEIRNVRPARPNDTEKIADCYGSGSGHTFFGVRDGTRWHALMQNVEQCQVYEADGRIHGYLMTALRQNPPSFDGEIALPTVRILELIAYSTPVRRGLIAFLATQTSAQMIEWIVPANELWVDVLSESESLSGTGIGEEILANIEIVPMLMTRLLNVRPLLEVHLDNADCHNGLRIEIHDSAQPATLESWTIVREPGGNHVRLSDESDLTLPLLSGDVRVWAQIFTGFKSAKTALDEGTLFASREKARTYGSALFPKSSPFLPIPDHF